jgi:hypothetical protein
MNEYTKQAEAFMNAHDTTMQAIYLGHFPRLGEYATSQWQVTFTRQGRKPFVLTFSQSLNESWTYIEEGKPFRKNKGLPPRLRQDCYPQSGEVQVKAHCTLYPVKNPPSAYDVLSCLTKSDPGTFKDFCGEFGYNDDSISAFNTYRAVQEEWSAVERMFNDCLEELQEIN